MQKDNCRLMDISSGTNTGFGIKQNTVYDVNYLECPIGWKIVLKTKNVGQKWWRFARFSLHVKFARQILIHPVLVPGFIYINSYLYVS